MSNWTLPPFTIHNIADSHGLSENADRFLTNRKPWEELHEKTGGGRGIKVGVGDTGVDKTHLDGDLAGVDLAKDFTGSRYGFYDRNGHGSHVTGHIGARANNDGIIGLAPNCTQYHAKVLGDNGSGSTRGIAMGIDWLAEQGCRIVSLSLGGGFSNETEAAMIRCHENNILVFAAMGNSGNAGDGHPGNSKYSLGIVAVDYEHNLAGFSSRSNMAVLSGYGVGVYSCWINGKYAKISGTSMATPDQAGIAALVLSFLEKHNLPVPKNNGEYFELIKPFLTDLGPDGWDRGYGYGFFDIWAFISAKTPTDPDPDPPTDPPSQEKIVLDDGVLSHQYTAGIPTKTTWTPDN